jgi:2-(1,2-epoxy-1,2-dihydrophenyl)acetyl-CoA isomerase
MQLLPRMVGQQRAKELVFSARRFDAAEAHALGIVYQLVAPAELMEQARALAVRFNDASTAAIGMAKSIMNQAFHLDAHAMAEFEAYAQTVCRSTEYHLQAVERFKTKQPVRFDWERE